MLYYAIDGITVALQSLGVRFGLQLNILKSSIIYFSEGFMKRFFILTLTVLLITGLISCKNSSGDNSSSESLLSAESQNNASSSIASSDESLNEGSKIEDLESEIDRLNDLLSAADEEKNDLLNQITDLEEEINELKSVKLISKTRIKDSMYLILKERNTAPYEMLSIEYPDKTLVDIIQLYNIWTIRVSPDATKIILDDYEFEYNAHVYMYDIEKRETRELMITDIPEYRTVSSMEWLNGRYFLFVVQFDTGTVVRGGDVYVYDTETDEYKVIIRSEDYWELQADDFDVYKDEFVIINGWMRGENTSDLTKRKHYLLTYDEIYDLIDNNKIIDLSKRESMTD